MKRLTVFAALVALMPCVAALAQEDGAKPWETWEPPAVQAPDPNAWDIYVHAFAVRDAIQDRLEAESPEGAPIALDMSAAALEPDNLARLVEAYAPVFSALDAAIAGNALGPRIGSVDDVQSAFRVNAKARGAARMLASRSVYDLSQDDALSAALDGIAAMHIGADMGTQHSMIGGLIQIACTAVGEVQLREAIPHLDADEARIVANALREAMAEMSDFAHALRGEETLTRLSLNDQFPNVPWVDEIVHRLYDDPDYARTVLARDDPENADLEGEALAARVEEKVSELKALTVEQVWPELDRFYAAQREEAAKPLWARESVVAPRSLDVVLPSFHLADMRFAYMDARLRVDLAATAAQAYLGENGAYPTSLDELVPDYLPEVPRDPFVDAPLGSVTREGVAAAPMSRAHPASQRAQVATPILTVYSVGPDGDDDGGVDMGNAVAREDTDGDIATTLTAL